MFLSNWIFLIVFIYKEISNAAQASLKKGKNTLAIHCHNTLGGQYVDVSLVYE